MMTTRKPCPAQDQAGPVSGEATLKGILTSHIHNTPPPTATCSAQGWPEVGR